MLRVARFLHAFFRPPALLREEEVELASPAGPIPATRIAMPGSRPRPGWVVLHGITVPGRQHPKLVQFARALAASGGVVVIPEITAWRELQIAPRRANEAIVAAVEHLAEDPLVQGGRAGLVGFSFGATQALISSTDERIRDRLRGVVGFGGYYDLHRTIRCMLTGQHEWRGHRQRFEPDPYGRWIIAANFLPRTPGYEHTAPLAARLHELAAEAGERRVYAADPVYDPLKAELRARLEPEHQRLWDLLAPPAGTRPDDEALLALVDPLVRVALEVHPELDLAPLVPRLHAPVVLAHGVEDRLVPYTEMLRLAEAIRGRVPLSVNLTRLFAHSTGGEALRWWEYPGEVVRYAGMLNRMIRVGR